MNMPKISIVMGVLLCAVGVAGAAHALSEGKTFYTALIPAYFGFVFIDLGVMSLALPAMRKHFMHGLAMLAMIGALFPFVRVAMKWSTLSNVSRASMLSMTVLCALTLALCVRSFIEARRARLTV